MSDGPIDPSAGAPADPPAGAPGTPVAPAPDEPKKDSRTLIIVGAAVAVVLLIIGAVLVLSAGGDDDDAGDDAAQEVFLEPVDHVQDPFTPPVGKGVDTVATTAPPSSTTTSSTTTTLATKNAVASEVGGQPGLYGGTRDKATCDKEKLVSYLEDNPSKGKAWASTLGIEYEDIRTYVDGLTPVLLRSDTRVTNHGYKDGKATSIQAVLQAGTAVLVDEYGRPVTKCACGNPLTAPVASTATYTGTKWKGFDPDHITVVIENTVIINTFVLIDNGTGEPFGRPKGTDGGDDGEIDDLPPEGELPPEDECLDPDAPPELCEDLETTTTSPPPEVPLDQLLSGSYTVQGTTNSPPDVCSSGTITLAITVKEVDGAWFVDVVGPGGTVSGMLEEDQLGFEATATTGGVTDELSGRFFVDGTKVTFEGNDTISGGGQTCALRLSGAKT